MTKIDDAMIERAQIGYSRRPDGSFRTPYPNADDVRRMLEAALSPEPEIPVSDPDLSKPGRNRDTWQVENILLAILSHLKAESARRKEAGEAPERRSGKDRRVNCRSYCYSANPSPWKTRGDKGEVETTVAAKRNESNWAKSKL